MFVIKTFKDKQTNRYNRLIIGHCVICKHRVELHYSKKRQQTILKTKRLFCSSECRSKYIGIKNKSNWANKTDEEKQQFSQKVLDGINNMDSEKRIEQNRKNSEAQKVIWASRTPEERTQILSIAVKASIEKLKNMTDEEREAYSKKLSNIQTAIYADEERKTEIVAKCIATQKENGTYGQQTSKPEEYTYELLKMLFGENDIEHWRSVNGWKIDFFIKSLDLYMELDGTYWHGLDRPLEEIKQFKTSRDISIYQRFLNNRKQDNWFVEHNLKLIRITDIEVTKIKSLSELSDLISSRF